MKCASWDGKDLSALLLTGLLLNGRGQGKWGEIVGKDKRMERKRVTEKEEDSEGHWRVVTGLLRGVRKGSPGGLWVGPTRGVGALACQH